MVKPKGNGLSDHSGSFRQPEHIIAAESFPQRTASAPDHETNGSGKRTIGGSFIAARRRAEQRLSNPSLPVVGGKTRTTPRLAEQEAPIFEDTQPTIPTPLVPAPNLLPPPSSPIATTLTPQHSLDSPPQYPTLLPAPNPSNEFLVPRPFSLSAASLINPQSVAHLNLEKLVRKPPSIAFPLPSEKPEHISTADLTSLDPTLASLPVSNQATPECTLGVKTETALPPPQPTVEPPIVHVLSHSESPIEQPQAVSKRRKHSLPQTVTSIGSWIAQPFHHLFQPTAGKMLPALHEKTYQPVETSTRASAEEQPAISESPMYTRTYSPYPLYLEPFSENEPALDELVVTLSQTASFYPTAKQPNIFRGYGKDNQPNGVELRITEDQDMLCIVPLADAGEVTVFLANPVDNSYPHDTRITFGLRDPSQQEALFSLNPTRGEQNTLSRASFYLAQSVSTALHRKTISKQVRQQLNHVFLAAFAHVGEGHVPISQPANVHPDGTWPCITTDQYVLETGHTEVFSANFHLYAQETKEGQPEPALSDPLNSEEGDLRIDSFVSNPHTGQPAHGLYYVLPKEGPARIITAHHAFLENEQTQRAALYQRTLAFLSALTYRDTSQFHVHPDEKVPTLDKINEVIIRLQEYLLGEVKIPVNPMQQPIMRPRLR